IRRWEEIYPGIVPKIFGYHENQDTASLLVEFLPGCTLDQIILTENADSVRDVIFIFEETLNDIWQKTRTPGPFDTDYMAQLKSRLDGVHRVHPHFYRPAQKLGALRVPSSDDLIQACTDLEKSAPAPFTVFIHGDFNVNNIVFHQGEEKVYFIDLHRSRKADYVQDASVFLVSIFRMPVFDIELRERLNTVSLYFYEWFTDFAHKNADTTFPFRLALALARSFYTSIRFELNRDFAREMYLRSLFLMEQTSAHRGRPLSDFILPESVLFY
ncbi:MAG: phosphotransferase, partial [Desulfococcaceae bacterium]